MRKRRNQGRLQGFWWEHLVNGGDLIEIGKTVGELRSIEGVREGISRLKL